MSSIDVIRRIFIGSVLGCVTYGPSHPSLHHSVGESNELSALKASVSVFVCVTRKVREILR